MPPWVQLWPLSRGRTLVWTKKQGLSLSFIEGSIKNPPDIFKCSKCLNSACFKVGGFAWLLCCLSGKILTTNPGGFVPDKLAIMNKRWCDFAAFVTLFRGQCASEGTQSLTFFGHEDSEAKKKHSPFTTGGGPLCRFFGFHTYLLCKNMTLREYLKPDRNGHMHQGCTWEDVW